MKRDPNRMLLSLLVLSACNSFEMKMIGNELGTPILPIKIGEVTPRFASAPNWNDFYVLSNTSLACTGLENDCVHGGSQKRIEVEGRSSCIGLTMSDELGAFDWSCQENLGQISFIGSTNRATSLSNLVLPTAWKSNSVSLQENGIERVKTSSQLWWTNLVVPLPVASSAVEVLSSEGTIYVATPGQTSTVKGYNINADKISIVISENASFISDGTVNTHSTTREQSPTGQNCLIAVGTQKFVSVEGHNSWQYKVIPTTGWSLDGAGTTTYLIAIRSSPYFRAKHLNLQNSLNSGIHVYGSVGTVLDQINIKNIPQYSIRDEFSSYGLYSSINNLSFGRSLLDSYSSSYLTVDTVFTRDHTNQFRAQWNGGIYARLGSFLSFKNLEILNSGCTGISLRESTNSEISSAVIKNSGTNGPTSAFPNVGCLANGGNGIAVFRGSNNTVRDVTIQQSRGNGIWIEEGSGLKFINVRVFDSGIDSNYSGRAGIKETGPRGASNLSYDKVTVSNNAAEGISNSYTGSKFSNIIATHNGSDGILIGATDTKVIAATVAHNAGHGIHQATVDAAGIYHTILTFSNGASGLRLANDAVGATVNNMASLDNGAFGISVGSPAVLPALLKVTGSILVSDNFSGDCELPGSISGLALSSGNCVTSLPSTGVLLDPGPGASDGVVGAVTVDSRNSSHVLGVFNYTTLTDWTSFDSDLRTWGKLGGVPGHCISGQSCQIYDWTLKVNETIIKNTSINGFSQNAPFVFQSACPIGATANSFDTSASGAYGFLKTALEDSDSVTGNQNGLCEANEDCIYTPNFGRDQGQTVLSDCVYDQYAAVPLRRLRGREAY